MDKILRRLDGELIHHFNTGGDDAGADDAGHTIPRSFIAGKPEQHGLRRLRLLYDPYRHLRDDSQQPLRTGHYAQHVVPGRVKVLAAQAQDLSFHGDHFNPHHVVRGQPVLEAMDSSRVFTDVAADGADDLAGGIRGVVIPPVPDGFGDRQVGYPGLGDHATVVEIDFENPVEFTQAENDAVNQGQGAA